MSLGRAVVMVGAAFCLTLAIIVVRDLSSEALAVAIGVVCGVAAGIPATILLYVTLSGRRMRSRRAGEEGQHTQRGAYPPVIIVQGQAPPLPQPSAPHCLPVQFGEQHSPPGLHWLASP